MKLQHGFTLVSSIITLSIIAILGSIAAPNLSVFLSKQEGRATIGIIHRNLSKARAHALKNDVDITVCGINKHGECVKSNFKELIMFEDYNDNAAVDEDDTITYISKLDYSGQLKLSASLGKKFIRLKRTGSSQQAGSFIYCDATNPRASNRVTISMSGRSYLGRDKNNDGIIELTNGKPISCS